MEYKYKKETIALCLPVYDKVFPKAWLADMDLMENLARLFPPENIAKWYCHKLNQPHPQNYLMNSVLENRPLYGVVGRPLRASKIADWILWVEDDTTPPANSFEILREQADPAERPVMHGLSFDKMPPYDPSIWRVKADGSGQIEPIRDWKDDTLYRIAHSGTCIMLLHTSVLNKLKRPWFRMQPFEPGCQGMIPCTSFSQRMHEAGVPIHAYTGCIAGHIAEPQEVNAKISRAMHARKQA